jgi:hypothetical protein
LNIQFDGGTKAMHACPNRMDPITTHVIPEEIEKIEIIKGPYDSGKKSYVKHTWEKSGTYTIKVRSRDSYDEKSDWVTLEVAMPKNKPYINTPYVNLFYVWFVRGLFKFLDEDEDKN